MRQETAYGILTGFGAQPHQAAAVSRIFSATNVTAEERERLVADIEKTGIAREAAKAIVEIFLDRHTRQ